MHINTGKSDSQWKVNIPEYLLWAEWDNEEETGVFHPGSGDTLLLNPLGAFLLKSIQMENRSTPALIHLAAQHFNLPEDSELTRAINTSLRTFERIGLILPAKP